MKKVVVAADSFKGCLNSPEVAESIEKGIKKIYPGCDVVKVPVADGGEGTTEALVWATQGKMQYVEVNNPLMQPVKARYGILGDGRTAVIEMSAASGLPLIPDHQRNPMLTTTYGTGQLILDALRKGCRNFILGIGGSATNDAGTGMLQALGYRFMDEDGQELGKGGQILEKIDRIDMSSCSPLLSGAQFKVACDVDNVFSGKNGAAYVYAPQKGADERMVKQLDDGLKHFAGIIKTQLHKDIDKIPGAGAAGGMGGGLLAFLNAQLQPGIELILETLRFDELLYGADLVITGEGRMDVQTAMGKAPNGIAKAASKHNIPIIALTGQVDQVDKVNKIGIAGVFSILPGPMSLQEAMVPETARKNIQQITEQLFGFLQALSR